MNNSYQGFLPYGSDDSSVIVQHPLTSEFTANDLAGTSLSWWGTGKDDGGVGNGRPVFDAVKGMLTKNATGTIAPRITGMPRQLELTNGGQISIEVSRDWACSSESDSTGENIVNEVLLAASQGGLDNIISKVGNLIATLHSSAGTGDHVWSNTTGTNRIHSSQKGDYILINIGWGAGTKGGFIAKAINGLRNLKGIRNFSAYTNKWNSWWIGSGNGANLMHTYYTGDAWVRNIQISSRPPVFPVHPLLSKVLLQAQDVRFSTHQKILLL